MAATGKLLLAVLGAASLLAFSSASLANDANGERDPSIYDQFPDCMSRGQVKQGQPAPCELPVPGSTRRPRAPLGSNVTPGSGLVSVPGNTGTVGAAANASVPSASQAVNRTRAIR